MLLNPKFMQIRAQTGMATVDPSVFVTNSPHRHTSFGHYKNAGSELEMRPRAKTTMTFHSGGGGQRKRRSFPQ